MKENNLLNNKNRFKVMETLITILITEELPPEIQAPYYQLNTNFLRRFMKQKETWGLDGTLSYFKELRLCFTRYLSGNPIDRNDLRHTIGLTKKGVPKILGPVLHRINEGITPREIRVILTLLTVGRTFEGSLNREPDLSSVITRSDYDEDYFDIEDFCFYVKERLGRLVQLPVECSHKNFHPTSKRGPNGHAMRTLYTELQLFKDKSLKEVVDAISPDISAKMEVFASLTSEQDAWKETFRYKEVDKPLYGKIVPIPDKEGKTRVVTLLNYWTQSALKPFHDSLMDLLTKLPYDHTHDQGGFLTHLVGDDDNSYHSIDLSNATDRFPLFLQGTVLSVVFGPKVGSAWTKLMSWPVHVPWLDKTVRFAVGQPMGAYSSWPAFALTHGLLVGYIADTLGVSENRFSILGDDIVITDDRLASRYMKILKGLDIPYSSTKTMQSKTTYEFAKRWVHKGQEVTPFPTGALLESLSSYPFLVETFRKAKDRGWFSNKSRAGPVVVEELFKTLKFHKVFTRKICKGLEEFALFPVGRQAEDEVVQNWVKFLQLKGHSVSCVSFRDQTKQTLIPLWADACREVTFESMRSIAQQSDDLWKTLYYSGLASTKSLTTQKQKLLEFVSPHLNVLRSFSVRLDELSESVDTYTNALNSDRMDYSIVSAIQQLRVSTKDTLVRDRGSKAIIRTNAIVFKRISRKLVEMAES